LKIKTTFMKTEHDFIAKDVLIIGSGLAGLLTALELLEHNMSVLIVTKGSLIDSNTSFAQGGLAAVTSLPDSKETHLEDTLKAGAGLTDIAVAKTIINEGEALIEALLKYGVQFDHKNGNSFDLSREAGHSYARVLHNKDATGRSISHNLASAVLSQQDKKRSQKTSLSILENTCATDLIVNDGRCVGARLKSGNSLQSVLANFVVLATGGIGQVFARTTNPPIATGDGVALAFRAGARLIDMEFVQFHPTALYLAGAPVFLISEAVRGAGAILLDAQGERFAFKFHPDGELATRDVVARAIHKTMEEQGTKNVYLDLRPIGKELSTRFPHIVKTCSKFGINPEREPLPVCPAAHYFMGGIASTLDGLTSVPGLYAIGECASTGMHGANRLASNSLLEAGVMGMQVAKHILGSVQPPSPLVSLSHKSNLAAPALVPADIMAFRLAMSARAGLVRNESGLLQLLKMISENTQRVVAQTKDTISSANMLLIGQLMATAALKRQESRGAHYRADFPVLDDFNYAKRLYMSRSGWGWLEEPKKARQADRQHALSA
jgi:L-aspartate oxidase